MRRNKQHADDTTKGTLGGGGAPHAADLVVAEDTCALPLFGVCPPHAPHDRAGVIVVAGRVPVADPAHDVERVVRLAGAVLGLLSVYRASRQPEVLERAADCGKYLLQKSVTTLSGVRAWVGVDGKPISGFSEGAAGIAYALLRLYQAAGDETMRSAAEETLAYEFGRFSKVTGNLLEQRDFPDEAEGDLERGDNPNAWLQDVVETGVGIIAGLALLDTPQINKDMRAVLQIVQKILEKSPLRSDQIWRGATGNVELLLVAGLRLDRSDLVEKARQEATRLAFIARREGGYRMSAFLERGNFSPGFFQGASGIGYQFLRLAYPPLLPNILLWE